MSPELLRHRAREIGETPLLWLAGPCGFEREGDRVALLSGNQCSALSEALACGVWAEG